MGPASEERLRESEALYRSILDASPDDITIADLEARVLMISPAAVVMFGYTDRFTHGLCPHCLEANYPEVAGEVGLPGKP